MHCVLVRNKALLKVIRNILCLALNFPGQNMQRDEASMTSSGNHREDDSSAFLLREIVDYFSVRRRYPLLKAEKKLNVSWHTPNRVNIK